MALPIMSALLLQQPSREASSTIRFRDHRSRFGCLSIAVLAAATMGCDAGGGASGDGPSAPGFSVRDSAGITITESPSDPGLQLWIIASEPLLVAGSETAPLTRIVGAVRTPDGGVVVGDAGASQLFWFDSEGALVAEAGGAGEGPGEYQFIQTLIGIPGDSLVAVEGFSYQVNLYGPERTRVRSWAIEEVGRFTHPAPFARLDDGTFVSVTQGTTDPYPGHQRYTAHLLRFNDGALVDTLGSLTGGEGFTVTCGPDGSAVCTVGVTYGRSLSQAARGDRVVLAHSDGDIQILDSGRLTAIVRVTDRPREVTPDAVSAFIDSVTADYAPDRAVTARERLAAAPSAEHYPRFVDVKIDPLGRIWAARGDAEPHRWDVFSPEGRREARIDVPAGSTVWQVGADWIVLSRLDDFGVPTVEVRGIETPN